MNRRAFLKRAVQAAAAVSAAAVVGREAASITGRSETHVFVGEAQNWEGDWGHTVPTDDRYGVYGRSAIAFIDSCGYREVGKL